MHSLIKVPSGLKHAVKMLSLNRFGYKWLFTGFVLFCRGILSVQVTESFFLLNGDFSLFHTLFLGFDFFSIAITASFSFLRISRTRA